MKTKIPIYRAKKIDSDEYVVGYTSPFKDGSMVIGVVEEWKSYKIDKSTLSIHFPDMLASDSDRLLPNGEKDLRIFASLSEDGKGGDLLRYPGVHDTLGAVIYQNYSFHAYGNECYISVGSFNKCKIAGIKQ